MTRVKICGITREEDAKQAVALGADALGLVFYAKSPRFVSAEQAAAIAAHIPAFTSIVGLFVNATAEEINAVLAQVPLDILQFHGDESADYCRQFKRPYIKAVRVNSQADILQAALDYPDARALLFDAHVAGSYGGTGETFDWRMLPTNLKQAWVLSGGLHTANIADAVVQTRALAVDVSSGVEATKGIKDAAKMREFIQGAKRAGTKITQ